MITHPVIYMRREVGVLLMRVGRGEMSERGDDTPRVEMTSKASVPVSAPLLLTKCSTKPGKGVCVHVSLFVLRGSLMCEA